MQQSHDQIDLADPGAVADILRAGAQACMNATCRKGSIDLVDSPCNTSNNTNNNNEDEQHNAPPPLLLATGDLHDNPIHFAKLVHLFENPKRDEDRGRTHITLHELIHADRLINGMDFSYRVLTRVAALKARYPDRVHVLLANHELAQLTGRGIAKDGINVVEAFDNAIDFAFDNNAEDVRLAVHEFIAAMPLALRFGPTKNSILCAHSLPAPWALEDFDTTILTRDLTPDDLTHRTGSAYRMVWGHSHTPEALQQLADAWNVRLFLLGHEKAESGAETRKPNAVILNSDHERGVVLPIRWGETPTPHECVQQARPLSA